MKKLHLMLLAASTLAISACADDAGPVKLLAPQSGALSRKLSDLMTNYVAIGTSISMGWADDGVVWSSQRNAWTKQLAENVGAEFSVPGIADPGCSPPLTRNLIGGTRLGPAGTCAPNRPGVSLPTHDLAVENATAGEGLNATPATASFGRGPVTSRVLPAGMTQVTAMRSLNPTFVSVEFGGNEILPAQVGLVAPGITVTPFPVFQANYSAIIDNVKATGAKAVLVTVRTDLRNFPTIRTGPEIAAQRTQFAAYNVSVNVNCDASENFIFVRGKVLTAIFTGAFLASRGAGPYDLSCANAPGLDYVLTPSDITFLNGLAGQMSDFVEAQAAENGYAVFSLGELYDTSKEGVPFDLESYLHSGRPYGGLISLDGVHPSAKGQAVLAKAARKAIQRTYGGNRAD
jgi:lysophospholipase L1-like esterase